MGDSDRELLELAAKAAGDNFVIGFWNPLSDDGDALRLAVKLEMLIHVETCYYVSVCKENVGITEHIGNDGKGCLYAATRRAITRAAAEIGRAM